MKTVRLTRFTILSVLIIVFQQLGFSQEVVSVDEFNQADKLERGKLLSTYKEFFKWKEYDNALESWWTIFNEYPDASEKLYVDGVTVTTSRKHPRALPGMKR